MREETHHALLEHLSMRRTACYGRCPVYTVTVYGDGRVEWKGEYWVEAEGDRKWSITKRRVTALAKAIERVNFFELDWSGAIGSIRTCQPSAIVSVKFNDGRSRTIDHYHGNSCFPVELDKLEKTIDRLAGTEPYVGKTRY